jgi:hypothetical protein
MKKVPAKYMINAAIIQKGCCWYINTFGSAICSNRYRELYKKIRIAETPTGMESKVSLLR